MPEHPSVSLRRQDAKLVSAFGSLRRSAESVADDAVRQFRRFLAARVPVCAHLADQLLVPLALAGGRTFSTLAPARHATTNAHVIRHFVPADLRLEEEGDAGTFRCEEGPS
jgi:RNA 3'-terminal phosphate cyclase (ATP)